MSPNKPRKCRAKNPATCPKCVPRTHQTVNTFNLDPKHNLTTKALTTPLETISAPPSWWKQYTTTLQNDLLYPTTPRLLGTMETHIGPVAVVYQEYPNENKNRGLMQDGSEIETCYLKHVDTGEQLGYMKITYATENSYRRIFGSDELSIYRFGNRTQTRFPSVNTKPGEPINKQQLWVEAHNANRQKVSIENAPTDTKILNRELKQLAKSLYADKKSWMKYKATPYVDFSELTPGLKGQGIGSAMYIYVLRDLAQRNLILRRAVSQTSDAKKVWERLRQNFPETFGTKQVTYVGNTYKFTTIDFRKFAK